MANFSQIFSVFHVLIIVTFGGSTSNAETLYREQIERVISEEYKIRLNLLNSERTEEILNQSITIGNHTLKWTEAKYGKLSKTGWPLWISLHGGGEVPAAINDEQWAKQGTLYRPKNGIYLTPRAPTDTWFMWNESHIDPLLERLIESMIAVKQVDPDRIYLMGYSAGGNGVYHLAPRMADRFAAVAAMAGYPSGAPLVSLRNLPFALFVGKHDITFDRVKEAEKWKEQFLNEQKDDPKGYRNWVKFYPDYGHWMHGEDSEALPWMAQFKRDSWPKIVVWKQDAVTHQRFYWLEIGEADAIAGKLIVAKVQKQTINIQGDFANSLKLWLSDNLLNLDQPVEVVINGKKRFGGKVIRSSSAIQRSLASRLDLPACATAVLEIKATTADFDQTSSQ